MEWWEAFLLIMGSLFFLMFIGMPVAFTFLVVNVVGAYFFFGGLPGMSQLVLQISDSLSTFTLVPVALFLVMGEIMFHSGIGVNLLDALDKWFGNLKGRLALLAVGGGVLFAALTGNSMGSVALLGSSLVPEMEKRGYGKPMSLGPILGSGGLAIMVPPSGLAVLLGFAGHKYSKSFVILDQNSLKCRRSSLFQSNGNGGDLFTGYFADQGQWDCPRRHC